MLLGGSCPFSINEISPFLFCYLLRYCRFFILLAWLSGKLKLNSSTSYLKTKHTDITKFIKDTKQESAIQPREPGLMISNFWKPLFFTESLARSSAIGGGETTREARCEAVCCIGSLGADHGRKLDLLGCWGSANCSNSNACASSAPEPNQRNRGEPFSCSQVRMCKDSGSCSMLSQLSARSRRACLRMSSTAARVAASAGLPLPSS